MSSDKDYAQIIKKVYDETQMGLRVIGIAQGATGIQGASGIQGIQGDTGIQGITGPWLGLTGPQGDTGIQGASGIQGVTGLIGSSGIQGSQGVTGLVGSSGIQGIQGDTGVQGIQGDTGIQGIQGDTGIQGLQGETGYAAPGGSAWALMITRMLGIQSQLYFDATAGYPANLLALITWMGTDSYLSGGFAFGYIFTLAGTASSYSLNATPMRLADGDMAFYVDETGIVRYVVGVGPASFTDDATNTLSLLQGETGAQGATGLIGVTGLNGTTGSQGVTGMPSAGVDYYVLMAGTTGIWRLLGLV